jgi:hypothetical protein
MRTAFLHGAGIAIANALVSRGFFFTGVHSSAERLAATQWLGPLLILGLCGGGLTLAVRERRAELPPEKEWGFAPAFGTGVLTGLFASLLGILPSYVYFAVINPGFSEVLGAMQRSALEAKGLSDAEIERILPMLEKFTGPAVLTASGAFMGFVWSSLVALVVAFFLRGKTKAAGS